MTLLDRYVLSQTMRRLGIALGIVLLTLVLERALRLFEFVAANNAAFGLVFRMAANLLPHYLGLALPAAFFISVLLLMARLGEDNELDVIMGSGIAVRHMARPVLLAGVLLAAVSLGLLGYVQPYARYGYRAIAYAATHALWIDAISEQRFYSPAEGVTILTDRADLAGLGFSGLFVHQVSDDGLETTMTAARGHVEPGPGADQARVVLEDVVRVDQLPGQAPVSYRLRNLTLTPDFPLQPEPFRPRGDDQRELTLGELYQRAMAPRAETASLPPIDAAKLDAELNARLVRAFSVVLMPLLAVPMGMAAKRQRRGAAITAAAVMLLFYHYSLQLGQGLVGLGLLSPLVGLWLPLAVFSAICFGLFRRIDQRLRPDPFEALFDRIDRAYALIRPRSWRKGRAPR